MASFSELNLKFHLFMRFYRYQRYKTAPHTPLAQPLTRCRVALITTAGFYLPTQPAFNESLKGGDCSYREIPNAVETQVHTSKCRSGEACAYHHGLSDSGAEALTIGNKSEAFDADSLKADVNLVFPLDRFREMEAEGAIGTLNHRHFSFMGSITKPEALIQETAPEVAGLLKADGVDAVFLTPV